LYTIKLDGSGETLEVKEGLLELDTQPKESENGGESPPNPTVTKVDIGRSSIMGVQLVYAGTPKTVTPQIKSYGGVKCTQTNGSHKV